MQEFKVNEYITLKLESKKANIYVKGELFEQCKFLLLNIPAEEIDSYNEIESIDEIAEKLGWTEDRQLGVDYELTPETEFFGHCSNLQAWVENNYDTRLLHRNLAFSLLKKLVDVGDLTAKKVFKEEISKRLASGFPSVINYLTREGYDNYLSREEYLLSFLNNEDGETLLDLEKILGFQFQIKEHLDDFRDVDECDRIEIKSNNIIGITLSYVELTKDIIGSLKELKSLRKLIFSSTKIEMLEELFSAIKKLNELKIYCDDIKEIPKSIDMLINLEKLIITGIRSKCVPNSLWNLKSLRSLSLVGSSIMRPTLQSISSSIENLKSLKVLSLRGNELTALPESIGHLSSLKVLSLRGNELTALPESIKKLGSLERLDLGRNPLKELAETIKDLHSLKILFLDKNQADEKKNKEIFDFLKKKGVKVIRI
ncbi:hypothetical protein LCGC14_0505600 [marine sediment metagenome]|uniref:Disease resistance R13L4/SHOC-2-like LRR domain-containing protein n=1 Tax=marine sediment metagenome TaxID=412755 RepID=A0A0F9S2M5_9ZZZZ|nr:MAG: leucine-rich repeat domain protein [Candidatus Lokiarchaeum sp. GC14_75]